MGKLTFEGLNEKLSETFTVSMGVHRNPKGPICKHSGCELLAGHRFPPHTGRDDSDDATRDQGPEGDPAES